MHKCELEMGRQGGRGRGCLKGDAAVSHTWLPPLVANHPLVLPPSRIESVAMKQYEADLRAAEAATGRWTWDVSSGYYYNAQHG